MWRKKDERWKGPIILNTKWLFFLIETHSFLSSDVVWHFVCIFADCSHFFAKKEREEVGFFWVFCPCTELGEVQKSEDRRCLTPLWKWWEGLKHRYQRGKKRRKVIIQSNYTPLRKSVFCTNCQVCQFAWLIQTFMSLRYTYIWLSEQFHLSYI